MEKINLFLMTICVVSGIMMVVFCFICGLTFGRKFDPLFKQYPAGFIDPQLPIVSKFFYRPAMYMARIVKGNKNLRKEKLYWCCGDYDFKANTGKFGYIFSYIFIIIIWIMVISMFAGAIVMGIAKILQIPID